MINLASNHVTCECDINCEIFDPMLLCGSDGVTYESLCHLKQTKCLQQRPIKIVNHDTCGKLEKFTFCFFLFIKEDSNSFRLRLYNRSKYLNY